MKQTIENASQVEAQDQDVIELGVASLETKGGGGDPKETLGKITVLGISDE